MRIFPLPTSLDATAAGGGGRAKKWTAQGQAAAAGRKQTWPATTLDSFVHFHLHIVMLISIAERLKIWFEDEKSKRRASVVPLGHLLDVLRRGRGLDFVEWASKATCPGWNLAGQSVCVSQLQTSAPKWTLLCSCLLLELQFAAERQEQSDTGSHKCAPVFLGPQQTPNDGARWLARNPPLVCRTTAAPGLLARCLQMPTAAGPKAGPEALALALRTSTIGAC
ncbi:hypothetical protein TASIC1_0011016300 [Trichoderma asperellum]|uniref:Uncharacterized protein n=1 Tax=Trichoderma asperellum TaxID=101201 RepID=A0A6V8R3X3_TRIAP|nr:hypothetical protein TASIC1_0011016300 [Trichoderma asperellum]